MQVATPATTAAGGASTAAGAAAAEMSFSSYGTNPKVTIVCRKTHMVCQWVGLTKGNITVTK